MMNGYTKQCRDKEYHQQNVKKKMTNQDTKIRTDSIHLKLKIK